MRIVKTGMIGILIIAGAMVASADVVTNGLVSWWRFEEMNGAITADSGPSDNTGTLYNAPAWTSDTYGDSTLGALDFELDGTNYVDCGNHESLNLTNAFTYEAWVKPESYTANHIIVSKGGRINLRMDDLGRLELFAKINGVYKYAYSSETLTTGEWYHVAATYDKNDTMHVYINGAEVSYARHDGTTIGTTVDATTDPVQVGARSINDIVEIPFDGVIDEVRIYSNALSEAELKQNYLAIVDSLICWWRLDETGGTTAEDSGLDYDGTLINGPVWTNDTPGGKSSGALYFADDAANDESVDCGNNDFFQFTNAITFEAWMKRSPGRSDGVQAIVSRETTALRMNDSALQVFAKHVGGNYYTTASIGDSPNVGAWTHVAATYDMHAGDNVWHIYVNGQEVSSYTAQPNTGGSALLVPTQVTMIGNRVYNDTDFSGTIDEVRIYRKALTPAEILDRYHWMVPQGTVVIIK